MVQGMAADALAGFWKWVRSKKLDIKSISPMMKMTGTIMAYRIGIHA